MVIVHDPSEEENPIMGYGGEFKMNHGITPPTRNIRKRKFRKIDESLVH
jgi:TATA-binding protein-associated factor Taf7